MRDEDFGHIANCSHLDTGEGNGTDFIELKDGRTLAITDDEITLYDDLSAAVKVGPVSDRRYIPL